MIISRVKGLLPALVIGLVTLGTPALAGPASERVFSTAALDLLQTGQGAGYAHTRVGSLGEVLNPLTDGEIRVAVNIDKDGKREAAVTMGSAGQLRPVSIWPASAGNPILPIFLESALRSMARATGGSEYYIRNRIKESLGRSGTIKDVTVQIDGADLAATEIVFVPFAKDKNRDRMAAFADMTLTFVVSENLPGDIVRFVAQTGDDGASYREEIAFFGVSDNKE